MGKIKVGVLLLMTVICGLSGCTKTAVFNHKQSKASNSEKIFKVKPENQQKEAEIKHQYAQNGLLIDISSFRDGYQITPKEVSLLDKLRNKDADGYIKNVLLPLSKNISQSSAVKIYVKANDPNNVLLGICDKGVIEYQLY